WSASPTALDGSTRNNIVDIVLEQSTVARRSPRRDRDVGMTQPSISSPPGTDTGLVVTDPRIRPIRPRDIGRTVELIFELAVYEKLPEECHITEEQLRAAVFAPQPA